MIRFIRRLLVRAAIIFFASTMLMVVAYRFFPVYLTPLMAIRAIQQLAADQPVTFHHQWLPLEQISPTLVRAVIASEDNLFMQHKGFDFDQIQEAITENRFRTKPRGASTITQQTAKNVFLWPHGSYVRKIIEVYFTVLIELVWGKERIMEIYLNSIEMGPGIYGAEAVAQMHFNKPASKLTRADSATIAATLPNPLRFSSAAPSSYIKKRRDQILRLMPLIGDIPFTGEKKVQ